MKLSRILFAVLVISLLTFPAFATEDCVGFGGSADAKYYQDQSASAVIGVTSSCYSENAHFTSCKLATNVDATCFNAADRVGCSGVMGVGQFSLATDVTRTETCGSYNLFQKSTALSGDFAMNQLGGVAATATGFAQASTCIAQNQHLQASGTAALPGGCATISYCGSQFATAKASAGF